MSHAKSEKLAKIEKKVQKVSQNTYSPLSLRFNEIIREMSYARIIQSFPPHKVRLMKMSFRHRRRYNTCIFRQVLKIRNLTFAL